MRTVFIKSLEFYRDVLPGVRNDPGSPNEHKRLWAGVGDAEADWSASFAYLFRTRTAREMRRIHGGTPPAWVYFLWQEEKLLYIGLTMNLWERLYGGHPDKEFTKATWFECIGRQHAFWLESHLIRSLKPPLNQDVSRRGEYRSYYTLP